jgi:hypothetical protein
MCDGGTEAPPPDLADYIERAFGPWTFDPPTRPLAVQGIDWPKLCDPEGFTGCPGTMSYVDKVPIQMATGEEKLTPGWRCDSCGQIDIDGLRARSKSFIIYGSE